MTARSRSSVPQLAGLMVCGALVVSSCSSGSVADADSELATLETAAGTDGGEAEQEGAAPEEGDLSADEAALALSECLRGEGLDVADIGVDASGNVDLRGALGELGPGDESFRDAMDVCREVLDGVEFGGGRGALADNTEIQDAFLEFSDCIRAEGFEDIPDLTLGGPGAAQAGSEGDGPGTGRGDREAGFGDRSGVFAERLGLDAEDPDVVAALDSCTPIIDQAFSAAGVGQPGGGG